MPRPRTYKQAARTQAITVRVTPEEHGRLAAEAKQHGLSIAGIAERYITKGYVRVDGTTAPAMHGALVAELKRMSAALESVAKVPEDLLPAHANAVAVALRDSFQLIVRDELLSQRFNALKNRTTRNDPATPGPRQEFQGVVHLRPARPESQEP